MSTLKERMQSGGLGTAVPLPTTDYPALEIEEVEVNPNFLVYYELEPGKLTAAWFDGTDDLIEFIASLNGSKFKISCEVERIPTLVSALRKFRGMTQAELGEAIGYPKPVIGNIEQGTRKLGLKTLENLIEALSAKVTVMVEAE
ncbi:helix-turn-helix domain-containing protein [Siphonobacter sp. SORGH_AS_1065]|uniref:helix-turn-helix domain-containing protein n=1 Tax=Siphonobacter sp. SORGH_AS_1065 TaxID=3041795 RepID=UPI00278A344A|nr:helix-turn-helix transcriptional regulator [Siphonobacter sp. SORGH_AS_1065]MDQ1090023.1 DNA-binding XRE family transcriptional regulator [Siphonobacter sp. SORGH_AS_1065]